MLEQLKEQLNIAYTENEGKAYFSSNSNCLDLFALSGALRYVEESQITSLFIKAYIENPDYAMRILFYSRDIRGGLGERRFFKVVTEYLANNYPQSIEKNIDYFEEYGRFDDLLCLLGTNCENAMAKYIKKQLITDLANMDAGQSISLLAKWLPSINTSSSEKVAQAKKFAISLE